MRQVAWSFEFSHPAERVWEFIANTDRLNHLIGLPSVDYSYESRLAGGTHRYAKFKVLGVPLRWKENPFEWLKNESFKVEREYSAGPFRYIKTEWSLEKTSRGCRVKQIFTYQIAHPILFLIGYFSIDVARKRDFLRAYAVIENYLNVTPTPERLPRYPQQSSRPLLEKSSKRYGALIIRLAQNGVLEPIAEKLLDYIFSATDLDLTKIRPFRLALILGLPRMDALSNLIKACQAGIVDLRWCALCPLCRGTKASTKVLGKMNEKIHCDSCNIEFRSDFSRSIELVFSPAPEVRKVEEQDYCAGSPLNTSHYLLQLRLPPDGTKDLSVRFPPGSYRLRSTQSPQVLTLDAHSPTSDGPPNPDGPIEINFTFTRTMSSPLNQWEDNNRENRLLLAPESVNSLHLKNATTEEITIILEQTNPTEEICTAALASSLPEFRNIFSSRLLDLGQNISFSSVACMFTDLNESTALYQKLGDAKAFVLIQKHFEILSQCVKEFEGGIVKTIGDSVMAVFPSAANALRAGTEIQKRITRAVTNHQFENQITTRIALHQGACFLIKINDILDFFGSTVNFTSRLLNHCEGNDITISATMFDDPAVRQAMKHLRVRAEQDIRTFKGFEKEFEVYRIRPVGQAG